MTATVLTTEPQIMAAIRALMVELLPNDVEIVKGQDNRVGVPVSANFVVINPVGRTRLSTNIDSYNDPIANGQKGPGQKLIAQPTQIDFDIDFFGSKSDLYTQAFSTVIRDAYATEFFDGLNIPVQVLYVSEPMQLSWTDESKQYENHWHTTVSVQANIVVVVPQQFADEFVVTIRPPSDAVTTSAIIIEE